MARLAYLAALAALLLAGCGENDTDPGPEPVTAGEAKALDEAAEMLDEQELPSDASPSATPSPEAGETTAAEPSG